jgi:hypothetical protein
LRIVAPLSHVCALAAACLRTPRTLTAADEDTWAKRLPVIVSSARAQERLFCHLLPENALQSKVCVNSTVMTPLLALTIPVASKPSTLASSKTTCVYNDDRHH